MKIYKLTDHTTNTTYHYKFFETGIKVIARNKNHKFTLIRTELK